MSIINYGLSKHYAGSQVSDRCSLGYLFIIGRIISISWHPTEEVIVTGGIDNVRLWSVKSGRAIQRLTLGRQRNKETVVWCVAILR